MAEMYCVRPTAVDTYLGNPHKGICTFQRFNGDELNPGERWSEEGPLEFPAAKALVIPGYLPSTVAYCRWFWRVVEPEEGKFDFSMIDRSLETCQQRGQTLAVRLMAFGYIDQPQIPDWYAGRYPTARWQTGRGSELIVPVHDSPEYFDKWGTVIREFGRRYDGHPLLESVDLAIVGPWGEGSGDCTVETMRKFTQLYKEVHPRTTLLCQIDGEQFAVGIQAGCGWRADCFGDLRSGGSTTLRKDLSFNHTYDAYPRQVCLAGANDTWRTMPVHFEACGVPLMWHRQGYDIDLIIQQGWKSHATYFMPKSTYLPDAWREKLITFCRHLGYRFVYRQATVEAQVRQGGEFAFSSWIENVGVAPIYRKYDFALRFRQGSTEQIIVLDDQDIRRWLPGDVWIEKRIPVPAGLKPGWVKLSAALCTGLNDANGQTVVNGTPRINDPAAKTPKVRFAVREQFSDGWVDLGGIEIVA